jgi:hypothetical protein
MRSFNSLKLWLVVFFVFAGLSFPTVKAMGSTTSPAENPAKTEEDTSSTKDTAGLLKQAIEDFHQVLMPLWHESFPKKDFQTIRDKAKELEQKLMALIRVPPSAELSRDEERLRDYLSKRQELAFSVMELGRAAKDQPDSTLASAFESMHWSYEELAKFFAVDIEELDQFHETLYFLWHKALPERDYQAIKDTAPVLKTEVDSLMKIPVPSACKVKIEEFEGGKTALKDAVYMLVDACAKGSEDEIDAGLKAVHDRFVDLNLLLR